MAIETKRRPEMAGCLFHAKKYRDFTGLAGCLLFFTLKYELYVRMKSVREIRQQSI